MSRGRSRNEDQTGWLAELKSGCLAMERDRGLRPRSVTELDRYLTGFMSYCMDQGVERVDDLTPGLLKGFVLWRWEGYGPTLVKGTVWNVRKLAVARHALEQNLDAIGKRPSTRNRAEEQPRARSPTMPCAARRAAPSITRPPREIPRARPPP